MLGAHLGKESLRRERLNQRACLTSRQFGPQGFELKLVFFQTTQTGTHGLTDRLKTAFGDLLADKGIEMIAKCN